jgi:hypothetical protein
MKALMALFLSAALVLAVSPAIAMCGSCEKDANADSGDMPDVSPEDPLDDVQGAGTSGRLAAQGPVGYDDNTGMMDVVPSDSVGDLE